MKTKLARVTAVALLLVLFSASVVAAQDSPLPTPAPTDVPAPPPADDPVADIDTDFENFVPWASLGGVLVVLISVLELTGVNIPDHRVKYGLGLFVYAVVKFLPAELSETILDILRNAAPLVMTLLGAWLKVQFGGETVLELVEDGE